jgi:hypothetical protein
VAAVAFFAVDAEFGAAADFNRPHQAQLRVRQRVFVAIGRTVLAKDLGQLESGPGHGGG